MIKIRTEKLVEGLRQKRKILAVEGALSQEQLPEEYLDGYPHVIWFPGDLRVTTPAENRLHLVVGETYDEREFQAMLGYIRQAGQRLHEINERRREILRNWRGEETFLV